MNVTLNAIGHDYGSGPVIENVSLDIRPRERIGIVGPNGSGKTTLLEIITGRLEPSTGTVRFEPDTRIGYVPQHLDSLDKTTVGDLLLHNVAHVRAGLRDLEERMAACDPADEGKLAKLLKQYEIAHESYENVQGDTAEESAKRLLDEVGLHGGLEQQISSLSGGERNVLSLVRALVVRPNLLILDEPGNHLDFAGLAWLESYLSQFDGSVVIVSHNRYLLDRVATGIWEVFSRRVQRYAGNYSDFRFNRLTKAISDQAVWAVQQRAIRSLESLVKTFEERARVTADPAWGKRLRARRSQLEKTKELALARPEIAESTITVRFAANRSKSDIAVHVQGYSRAFGDTALFTSADLLVNAGERVGMIGPNGCGKTTFLTDLVKTGDWNNPQIRVGPSMSVGYCAQQRDRFVPESSVIDAMLTNGNFTRHEVFGVLSRLLFGWDDLERPVRSLSGGEWNRLQLGAAIITKANLLVLDEPTNHLDIPSREAVEEALAEFDGTIIAVSHDRYFLDAVANRIVAVKDQGFRSYPGSFTEYWYEHAGHTVRNASLERRAKQTEMGRRRDSGEARPSKKDHEIESKIVELESKQVVLEREMGEAFASRNYQKGRSIARHLEKVRSRLNELYEKWGSAIP